MAAPGAADDLRARLAAVNPGAPVIDVVHGRIAAARLLDAGVFDLASKNTDVEAWLNEVAYADDHDDHAPDRNRHRDDIEAFCLHADKPLEMQRFVAWIERLFEAHGEHILRLKGVLDVVGCDVPLAVHGVQHIFHPVTKLRPWPDGERRSRVVIITQNLPRRIVEESFVSTVFESY